MKVFIGALAILLAGCTDNGGQNDSGSDAPADGPQGDSGDAASDAPPDVVVPPKCNVGMQWGTGTNLSISTAQSDLFGAVT